MMVILNLLLMIVRQWCGDGEIDDVEDNVDGSSKSFHCKTPRQFFPASSNGNIVQWQSGPNVKSIDLFISADSSVSAENTGSKTREDVTKVNPFLIHLISIIF